MLGVQACFSDCEFGSSRPRELTVRSGDGQFHGLYQQAVGWTVVGQPAADATDNPLLRGDDGSATLLGIPVRRVSWGRGSWRRCDIVVREGQRSKW